MATQKEKAPVGTPEPSQTKEDHVSTVTYTGTQRNRKLLVARGFGKNCEEWDTTPVLWGELVAELSVARIMPATMQEYRSANEKQQGKWKDGPGFVGGGFSSAKRSSETSVGRDLLTFDLEHEKALDPATKKMVKVGVLPADILARVAAALPCEYFLYSTPSHTPDDTRYRVVVPVHRTVTPHEYDGITRFVAEKIGLKFVDKASFSVNQFMYFPAVPRDLALFTIHNKGEWFQADRFIEEVGAIWHLPQMWPGNRSAADKLAAAATPANEASDPFVRAVNMEIGGIRNAIETYLSDIYEQDGCDYTFIGATGTRGLVVYEDKEVAFSFHSSDPANNGHCHNAFDLIRIHKFGHLDADVPAGEDMGVLPSYGNMIRWADEHIPDYKIRMAKQRGEEAAQRAANAAAKEESGDPDAWMSRLAMNSRGNVSATIANFKEIIRSDPNSPFGTAFNLFTCKQVRVNKDGTMQDWEDGDDRRFREYCETTYGIHSEAKCDDGTKIEMDSKEFDPLKDYLNGLVWDGVPRLDRMLIDFMGAKDDWYSQGIARSWMLGGVERGLLPSRVPLVTSKFDYMLILKGDQGVGKSTFLKMLVPDINWYTDSVEKLEADKDTRMTLLGKWIIEIGELAGMNKAEVRHIKTFLSAEKDDFRLPYGRSIVSRPRRCIFSGSSNDIEILRDATGNRRFFVLDVAGYKTAKTPLTPEIVNQLWAEAVWLHKSGVKAEPSDELKREVAIRNADFEVSDEWEAPVLDYLTRRFPQGWNRMPLEERATKLAELRRKDDDMPELAAADASAHGYALLPFVCRKELFDLAIGIPHESAKTPENARLDSIMRKHAGTWEHGGDKKQRIAGYPGLERVWYRK